MPVQSLPQFPWLKGIVASNQPLAEPKGAVVRVSNLLMTARGAADPCDGSLLLFAYNGAPQTNFGRILATFLFEPTGVAPYYLAIAKAPPGIGLGAPQGLTVVDGGAGGTIPANTYHYLVTAIDGAGGETMASANVSFVNAGSHLANLTWNVVPNAVAYNIYRGASPSTNLQLLVGANVPVPQPASFPLLGPYTVTFSDNGADATSLTFNINAIVFNSLTQQPTGIPGITRYFYTLHVAAPIQAIQGFPLGVVVTGNSNVNLNTTYLAYAQPDSSTLLIYVDQAGGVNPIYETNGTGGSGTIQKQVHSGGPTSDTTQPTVLYKMPVIAGSPALVPISYNSSNIVAYYPADPFTVNPLLEPPPFSPPQRLMASPMPFNGGGPTLAGFGTGPGAGRAGSGGGGPSGGIGPGGATGGATTSGGVPGNVSFIPMFKQFTNRAIIALGNGVPPQIYYDTTTPVNPATIANISNESVSATGQVTIYTSTTNAAVVGGNMLIQGATDPVFDGVYTVIATPAAGTNFVVQNTAAIGHTGSAGGTATNTSSPLTSNFIPTFPAWTANTALAVGDIIVPVTQPTPAVYLTVTQAGTTGTSEPTPWPTTIGQTYTDHPPSPAGPATVQYVVSGNLVGGAGSPAPPPPGAAHIEVYAGALWVWNTAAFNTSNGLDGPCSLRMSNINNPLSWNPVNQAFLDKDDGQEGMGLAKFTVTALGIPPEGSLIAFKNYEPYQLIGVFGAANFAIQPVSTDLGCISPRTLNFVPGFGVMRNTHLGIAVFNGVKDEVMSEQIRPYLFPTDDQIFADITSIDSNWIGVAWAAQTANPPMYCVAVPVGITNGQLTRIFCFDLVMKAWTIVDLPFPISTMSQFKGEATNPITVFGAFSDATITRWQAGDEEWYQNGNAPLTGTYTDYIDSFVDNAGALTTLTLTTAASKNDFGLYIACAGTQTLTMVNTPPSGWSGVAQMTAAAFYGAQGTSSPGTVTGQSVFTYSVGPINYCAAGLLVLFPTTGLPVFSLVANGPSGGLFGGLTLGGGVAVVTTGQVLFMVIQGGSPLINSAVISDNHGNTWYAFPVPTFSTTGSAGPLGANVQLFICPNPVPATNYTFTMQTVPPGNSICGDCISAMFAATNIVVPTTGITVATPVAWSFRPLTVASGDTDQRVYVRRLVFTAINGGLTGNVTIAFRGDRQLLGTRIFPVQGNLNFDLDCALGFTGKQFDAIISGTCNPTIDGVTWEVEPRPAGVVVGI